MKVFTAFTQIFDKDINKIENQIKFLKKSGLENKKSITMNQIHGNKVCIVNETYNYSTCDALITQRKDVALFTRVADCQPVLMWDEKIKAIPQFTLDVKGYIKISLKKLLL